MTTTGTTTAVKPAPNPSPLPGLASTVAAALAAGLARLRRSRRADPDNVRLDVAWLVSRAIGCPRLDLPLLGDRRLAPRERRRIVAGLARLAAGEPLAYVLGDAEFMGRVFACDRRALIPRPETEQLAAAVLGWAPLWRRSAPRVADVGTGGGCLAVTLALERPAVRLLAVDISPAALALARRNAGRHGVAGRLRFRRGDLLAGLPPGRLDAVVSNPPYVAAAEWARCPTSVRAFEPRRALDGGVDGLAVIRRLIGQARAALAPGGWLFLEIGAAQGRAVRALLAAAGFGAVRILSDLAGRDRVIRARREAPRRRRRCRRPRPPVRWRETRDNLCA